MLIQKRTWWRLIQKRTWWMLIQKRTWWRLIQKRTWSVTTILCSPVILFLFL
jgi:hypothetical protein